MSNKETLQNYNTNLEENNETLFSILEIINELPEAGGDGIATPTSLSEIDEAIAKSVEGYIEENLKTVDTNAPYTTEPITLYTPVESYEFYFIRQNSSGYQVVWAPNAFLRARDSSSVIGVYIDVFKGKAKGKLYTSEGETRFVDESTLGFYRSNAFSTLEACIEAVQNPNTQYTQGSPGYWGATFTDTSIVPCSNMVCMDTEYNLCPSMRISSNETIVVIPTTE